LFSALIVIYTLFIVFVSFYHFFKSLGYLSPVKKMESLIFKYKASPESQLLKQEILNLIDSKVREQFLNSDLSSPAKKTSFEEVLLELNVTENKYKEVMCDCESFYELYRTTTFKYAAESLKYHKVNVVSLMSGYGGMSGPRNFTNAFKKIYNITPSELKRDPKLILN